VLRWRFAAGSGRLNAVATSIPSGADPAVGAKLDRVVVIGTAASRSERDQREVELDELEELARTLGTKVLERDLFTLREPHPATFLRSGTVDNIAARIAELDRPAVLCNDQLTPRQQRNLQEAWDVPVLDRTEVILAIFARRARTAEGRVQVEMAQLEHLLPRLAGGWSHLERQRGGVGLRGGPGEKQIEVDRRLIRHRVKRLRERLAVIERQRQTRRTARTDVPLASCALVGYTNAGKSTLLNRMTNSEVLADNLLFATLDPTSRRLELPSGRRMILTDTVGFIQNLPTELVEAFAATLEEVRQAHLLAIVVDGSHPDVEQQLETVLDTLAEMGCNQPARLLINKCDRLAADRVQRLRLELGDLAGTSPLAISAAKGTGLREFRQMLDDMGERLVPQTRANRSQAPVTPVATRTAEPRAIDPPPQQPPLPGPPPIPVEPRPAPPTEPSPTPPIPETPPLPVPHPDPVPEPAA
jgi:GTPase